MDQIEDHVAKQPSRFWLTIAALLAGTAVGLGAWAAHGLEGTLAPVYEGETREAFGHTIQAVEKYVGDFRTGVTYQMWHALALLAIASRPGRAASIARGCLLAGTVVFSGSLYILAMTGVTKWGAVTPIGGLLLLVGWGTLVISSLGSRPSAGHGSDSP